MYDIRRSWWISDGRLREELAPPGRPVAVEARPDLWDLPAGFGTAVYPVPVRGERELKIDLVEQAFHVLRPRGTLLVADAGYVSYELLTALQTAGLSFLLRLSSRAPLYVPDRSTLKHYREGLVYYWPVYVQEQGRGPIPCRLIRVPAKGQAKHDVWLLTNILDPARLSAKTAAKFYRWRWRNEGVFRIYKRTINKIKLSSRTVRLVHREAEASLLALQLLLAHADLALRPSHSAGEPAISPRKVLQTIRQELKGEVKPRAGSYRRRLEGCRAEAREQKSPKACREWPRRKPYQPPAPPKLHTLTDEQKVLIQQYLDAA